MIDAPLTPPDLSDGVVRLRPPTLADVDVMTAGLTDPDTARWLISMPAEYGREQAVEWVRDIVPTGWSSGRHAWFAVADATTDEFLGELGMRDIDPTSRSAEVGYWLTPQARGWGAMHRALVLVLRWGIDDLGLERFDCATLVGNTASRKAAESVGFQLEGTRRERALRVSDGTRHDEWILGLLSTDLAPATYA